MSAIVKLGTGSRTGGPLGIPSNGAEFVSTTSDHMGIQMKAGRVVKLKDGNTLSDGIINANQKVIVYPAVTLNPKRYTILVSYNPELLEYGEVNCPAVVNFKEVDSIKLRFTAAKKTELHELDYIFLLHMVD